MGSSYLPSGVKANCTFMTNGVPNELGPEDGSRSITVFKGQQVAALLNENDRKISASFACKSPAKFWGGLQMLTAVLAVAAFAACVIATGGAALVVAGIALAVTAGTSITASFIALYKTAHDCDLTLKSKWMLPHRTVKISGKQAIVLQSCMKCNNGGIIQPFLNSATAAAAATKITNNNMTEFYDNESAQAWIGFFTVVGTLDPTAFRNGPGPTALLVSSIFAISEYNEAEGDGPDGQQTIQSKISDTYYDPNAQNGVTEDSFGWENAIRDNAAGIVAGGADTRMAGDLITKGGVGRGVLMGAATTAINYKIGSDVHKEIQLLSINTVIEMRKAKHQDSANNISIVAQHP